jgi:hypothetical protein
MLSMDVSLLSKHLASTVVLPNRDVLLRRLPSNGMVAEVGVADGKYSLKILEINRPAKLILIDAWGMAPGSAYGEAGYESVQANLGQEIQDGLVCINRGMSWERLEQLPDNYLDWIYIDASHDYDSVKRDLEMAKTKVKGDGFIAGHDYVRWGRFGGRFGVLEAVNEFCLTHDYEVAYLTLESNYNWSYALRKMR